MPRRRFPRDSDLPKRPQEVFDFDWVAVIDILRQRDAGDPVAWDGLAKISAPTLLVGGGPGSHIPHDKLDKVAEGITECRLVTIPAGHNVHATHASEFVDAVLNWIACS
jgi:pimeloyl-ACP methyl ester carboxylesterase